jgi:hypothetical protein
MRKRRPDRKQLLEAGAYAREMLKEKGIFSEQSIIDSVLQTPGSPTLPGYGQLYIPRRHTIEITKMILYSIAKVWNDNVKDNRREKVDEFFKYVVKELRKSNSLITQMLQDTLAKSKFELVGISLLTTQENTKAIQRFLIDSFAVYPNLMTGRSGVSDYLDWFITWTSELQKVAKTLPNEPAKTKTKAIKSRLLGGGSS